MVAILLYQPVTYLLSLVAPSILKKLTMCGCSDSNNILLRKLHIKLTQVVMATVCMYVLHMLLLPLASWNDFSAREGVVMAISTWVSVTSRYPVCCYCNKRGVAYIAGGRDGGGGGGGV